MSEEPAARTRPALSPSRAADFKQCPLLYRFRAIDRLPEPPSTAQLRGSVVHAALEQLYALPAGQRDPDTATALVAPAWERAIAADPDLAAAFGPEERGQLLDEARALLSGYYRLEDPRRFDPQSEARALFQMKFYAVALLRSRDVLPTRLRLIYLADGQLLDYSPDHDELVRFEKTLTAIWQAIRSAGATGDFRPNPSRLCAWCAHQALCPAFGGTPPPYPGWPAEPAA